MSRDHCRLFAGIVTALFFSLGSGCSKSDPSRYIPAPAVAEESLRAALEAWRAGQPAGTVTSYNVPIQVADTHRRAGQKLKGYEILGEVSVDGGRRFQVRLDLENPDAQEKVQYIVVGIDPLWVFRREDYDMITHWDHPMPAVDAPSSPSAAAKRESATVPSSDSK